MPAVAPSLLFPLSACRVTERETARQEHKPTVFDEEKKEKKKKEKETTSKKPTRKEARCRFGFFLTSLLSFLF
jgi:hypothetical protein